MVLTILLHLAFCLTFVAEYFTESVIRGRWVIHLYAVLSLHIVTWYSVVPAVFGVLGLCASQRFPVCRSLGVVPMGVSTCGSYSEILCHPRQHGDYLLAMDGWPS